MQTSIRLLFCLSLLGICLAQGPRWEVTLADFFQAGIKEDTPAYTEFGQVKAVSQIANPSVIYAIDSDIIGITSDGRVFLGRALDREKVASHNITFHAFDFSGMSTSVTVQLRVLDVDDNPPIFKGAPYTFSLSESTLTSTVVFSGIQVTDSDVGTNAEITLSCGIRNPEDNAAKDACDTFEVRKYTDEIGITTGIVVLKKPLDFKVKSSYTINIKAQGNGTPPHTQWQTISVIVQEKSQLLQQPIFLNVPLRLTIYENRNDVIRQIQAKAKSEDSTLTIRIKSDSGGYFKVGPTTKTNDIYSATLQTVKMLDREMLEGGTYSFTVEATESRPGTNDLRSEALVAVEVIDVNDNSPKFDKDSYTISLREDETGQNLLPDVFIISDADTGDNSYLEISLTGYNSEYFAVVPAVVTQHGKLQLKVLQTPDFDDGTHQIVLTMIAQETVTTEKFSATAQLTINVVDVNDNDPRFSKPDYTSYVREDREINYLIDTIKADDLDATFGRLVYSLSGDGSDMFSVNPDTGDITLAKPLDFEKRNKYNLQYTATDSGMRSTSVPISIEVLDRNDEGPVFEKDRYTTYTNESSTVLNPNVTVKAVDQETDEVVTYKIVGIAPSNPNQPFTIGKKTGELQLTRYLSYEETNQGVLILTVEASDNGIPPQQSMVPVIVNVIDENSHSPVFENATYYKTIFETAPSNTPVVMVSAKDLDSGLNGRLSYLIASSSLNNFVIDRNSGQISVSSSANLDVDAFGSNYNIKVYAVDQGVPQRTATAQVFITVREANNKKPKFDLEFYTFTVMDSLAVSTLVDRVLATDSDVGNNIRYSIRPGSVTAKDRTGKTVTSRTPIDYTMLFRIDPVTGNIYTNGTMNRDFVAEVGFEVLANDTNGETRDQLAMAEVIITIRTTADSDLKFGAPWSSQNPVIQVYISEEEPGGTLITTVVATDPQTGQIVRNYRKVDSTDPQAFFTVDKETGEIRLNKRMDYENSQTKQKSFRVEAFTQPPNVRSAMATITITTKDINDHNPQFLKPRYTFEASEQLTPGDQIGKVQATDEDDISGPFGKITYSLSGQGANAFYIHPELGQIEVAEDKILDREFQSFYQLQVRATDGGGKYTEVPLDISIMDENDNGPLFSLSEYNMYTLEYIAPATSLGQVHATDQDIGPNGVITYRITNGNEPTNINKMTLADLFQIESSTGILLSKKDFFGFARDYPYSITVEAQDNGKPSRKTSTIVQIHVTNVDRYDGRPTITFPDKDGIIFTIPENTVNGTNITRIVATDPDLGPEGELQIGFVDNEALAEDHSFFNIDLKTGLITIKKDLDREYKEEYQLLIFVEDKGDPPNRITRKIVVRVTDINDNKPSFVDKTGCPELDMDNPLYASVKEEVPPQTPVTTVKACDPDAAPNNKVYYFIVCGNKLGFGSDDPAFSINKETGEIFTEFILDREKKSQYQLCIYASSDPNPNITIIQTISSRQKRQVHENEAILNVIIDIIDVNDNGPHFPTKPGQEQHVIGLPSNLPYGTEIIKMQAEDPDGDPDYKYSINSVTFIDFRQQQSSDSVSVFIIDPDTGSIQTGRENYKKYRGGLFTVNIQATDSQRKMASTDLLIYVLSAGQRLKFTFGGRPNLVWGVYESFITKMNGYLLNATGSIIKADTLKYAIDYEGKAIYNGTDVCFYMLHSNQVIGQQDARNTLRRIEANNNVKQLYSQYHMQGIDACEPHVTTKWWSNWWWLWWLLIALALFIILVCIIVLIVICCCWPRLRSHAYYTKPFVVMDPVSVVPPNYDYEWQEQVVKMN